MKQTPLERKITEIATPCLEGLGFRLVLAQLGDSGGAHTLRIFAENAQGNLSLDECTEISRTLGALLDVEDPIPGAYSLEVGSPGLDRPLVTLHDYTRFAGREARIELDLPLPDGQKRFRGILKGESQGMIALETETGEKNIPFDQIEKARLVPEPLPSGKAGKKPGSPSHNAHNAHNTHDNHKPRPAGRSKSKGKA